ncbi:MAG: hypothetical protein QM520_05655 [Gammaproteobacteria bacterium]|nr:hypothetical protein [Gammaproteobacteria bacterium]
MLGVLPGTGGLTRLTDKRRVRHDLADVFCTLTEGIRGDKAVQWKLVDAIAKPVDFPHLVDQRAQHWLEKSTKLPAIQGIQLTPLERLASANKLQYKYVIAHLNRPFFRVEIDILAPTDELEDTPDAILNAGDRWYPLQLVRELEDLILYLRTNESDLGVWVFRSKGELEKIQKMDEVLQTHAHFWLVKETKGYWRRTLSRLDVTSRSLFCFIDNEACFAGTLLEIALACDRIYMLDSPDGSCLIALSAANFGDYPMSSGDSRLQRRFNHDPIKMEGLQQTIGQRLQALKADELGLITFHPDELDWDDETRLLLEERVALSPDALTAMEANLRFTGPETMATRIFARLTAWQNWVFQRPNAVGPQGALKTYGTGSKPQFDKNRV